ncbi:MAG: hydrogenase maturation peptidase HycI [Candidatus Thorarchaeota archaeon]|nr:hydrogenase maturation peptidase HycI [Candidatus Thorarchaeota archaeon]
MLNNSFEDELRTFITGANKIAILGIGNDLRSDDGLGLYIIEKLSIDDPRVMIENVGSVPEGFARPLAEFGAERVIMVDAADMGKSPGHTELITKDRIGGVNISTHSMPLSFLMMYLEQETGGQTILIGIQPKSIQFGEGLTPEVQEVVDKTIISLERVLKEYLRG